VCVGTIQALLVQEWLPEMFFTRRGIYALYFDVRLGGNKFKTSSDLQTVRRNDACVLCANEIRHRYDVYRYISMTWHLSAVMYYTPYRLTLYLIISWWFSCLLALYWRAIFPSRKKNRVILLLSCGTRRRRFDSKTEK